MLQFYNFKVQMNLQLLRIGQKLGNVIFTTVKKIAIDTENKTLSPGLANSNAPRG